MAGSPRHEYLNGPVSLRAQTCRARREYDTRLVQMTGRGCLPTDQTLYPDMRSPSRIGVHGVEKNYRRGLLLDAVQEFPSLKAGCECLVALTLVHL